MINFWPFKSKIPCLESINNDADGNIVLDLTDKSFRFNEKDILSVKYESDFYSPTYVRTESSNWHLFIQLVITFIITCGIMNVVIYYSSISHYDGYMKIIDVIRKIEAMNEAMNLGFDYNNLSEEDKEFIKSDRSFSSFLVIFKVVCGGSGGKFLVYFAIIFPSVYYTVLLLRRLIRKYILLTKRPFYLKKDLVFIRLHNQNINFRINQKGHTDLLADLFRKKVDRTTVKKKVRIIELYSVDYSSLVYLGILVVALGAFYLNYDEPYWWYKLFESHDGRDEMIQPLLPLTEKMSNWTAYFAVLNRGILGLFFDGVMSGIGLILLVSALLVLLGLALIVFFGDVCFPSVLILGIGTFIFPETKMTKKILNVIATIVFLITFVGLSYIPVVFGDKFLRYYTISVWAILLVVGLFFLVKGIIEHRRKKETNDAEKPKKAPALRFIDYYPEELELKFSDGRVLTVGQFIDSSNPLLKDIYAFDFFAYKYINFELLDQFKG